MEVKKFILLLGIVSFGALQLNAQSEDLSARKLGIGFSINQIQKDFGVGLHLVSPYFAKSTVAIRLGGNFQWFEHINDESEMTWTPYNNLQFGIRARQAVVESKLFVYGEGGSMIVFPNSDFSSESTEFGGYGLFGFEFKPISNFGFFAEFGGVGLGAKADKILGKPIYSNGFLNQVGLRFNP